MRQAPVFLFFLQRDCHEAVMCHNRWHSCRVCGQEESGVSKNGGFLRQTPVLQDLAPMFCTSLLDHLVRQDQKGRRYRDPKGLSGLEVNDELELHGLLHGQVPWLSPFENLVHIGGGAPVPLL
jgi:hypothetical protein